jgi:hypothetical protein
VSQLSTKTFPAIGSFYLHLAGLKLRVEAILITDNKCVSFNSDLLVLILFHEWQLMFIKVCATKHHTYLASKRIIFKNQHAGEQVQNLDTQHPITCSFRTEPCCNSICSICFITVCFINTNILLFSEHNKFHIPVLKSLKSIYKFGCQETNIFYIAIKPL